MFAALTIVERIGRKTVMVAGLLANSVTAETRRQANSVIVQGGRLFIGSNCLPIHTDRPETCPGKVNVMKQYFVFQQVVQAANNSQTSPRLL